MQRFTDPEASSEPVKHLRWSDLRKQLTAKIR